MAENLRDYRRRIKSVRNTVQLTKAMKMVAAAKLRRSQEAMMAARPYSAALGRVLLDVSRRAHPELHPLLAARAEKKVDLIVCTGDRGLAGAFNTNILKAAEQWRAERERAGIRVEVTAVGRKAGDYFRRRPSIPTRRTLTDIFRGLTFDAAREIAEDFQQRFVDGETDGVFIAYNEFRSVIAQKVTILPILPLAELAGAAPEGYEPSETEYIYEPEPEKLLGLLLTRYVAFRTYHAFLESVAAENAARMSAMENATRNGQEMIEKLTLQMNRIRQAAITKEIIEVVSGAGALEG